MCNRSASHHTAVPPSETDGFIIITNVAEGTTINFNIMGDDGNSSCDLDRTINSPVCVGALDCPNVGDVIVTEIMKNPSAVNDSEGEYFEVYNTTGADIDMQGWDITDADGDSRAAPGGVARPPSPAAAQRAGLSLPRTIDTGLRAANRPT